MPLLHILRVIIIYVPMPYMVIKVQFLFKWLCKQFHWAYRLLHKLQMVDKLSHHPFRLKVWEPAVSTYVPWGFDRTLLKVKFKSYTLAVVKVVSYTIKYPGTQAGIVKHTCNIIGNWPIKTKLINYRISLNRHRLQKVATQSEALGEINTTLKQ